MRNLKMIKGEVIYPIIIHIPTTIRATISQKIFLFMEISTQNTT